MSLGERSVRPHWGSREVTKKAKTRPRQSVPNSGCPEKVTRKSSENPEKFLRKVQTMAY